MDYTLACLRPKRLRKDDGNLGDIFCYFRDSFFFFLKKLIY